MAWKHSERSGSVGCVILSQSHRGPGQKLYSLGQGCQASSSLVQTLWLLVVTKSVMADSFQYMSLMHVIRTLSKKLPYHWIGNNILVNMLLAALPLLRCCPGPRSHYMEQLKSSFRLKRGLEMVNSSCWSCCCCFALSEVRSLLLLLLLSSTWSHLGSPWSHCLL